MDLPFEPREINIDILEAECGDYLGSQRDVIPSENASNGFILRGNAQNDGESPIARQVNFEFDLDNADSYRIWFRGAKAGVNGALKFKMDEKAINGLFVETDGQIPSLDTASESMGMIAFEFEVEAADEYEIWAKIQTLDLEGESSLWTAVDDQSFRKFSELQNELFLWYWKKFHCTYESDTRSFSYFLEAGQHTIKIAYTSGNVAIDRIAVATAGKNPAEVDPAVVNLRENLEFEAELATILGTAQIMNCATSFNGQQVNMGNLNSNGVRFDQIVAEKAGTYKLLVSYMSAVQRSFRLTVNGQNLGQQILTSSGAWCSGGGSPAVWEISVQLNEGLNLIQFNPFSGYATFIDKIKLEKSVKTAPTFISLEAEDAELVGTFPTPACYSASNGQIVNMGFNTNHKINCRNVKVDVAGTYNVEFQYFSNSVRKMRIITNGNPRIVDFPPTGAFCFAGGSPGTQIVELELNGGVNVIKLTPIEGDAPIMDKIVIRSYEDSQEMMRTLGDQEVQLNTSRLLEYSEFKVYPNSVKASEIVTIQVPSVSQEGVPVQVIMTDMTGRLIYVDAVSNTESESITLNETLQKGIYVVMIQHGNQWFTKKLKVE